MKVTRLSVPKAFLAATVLFLLGSSAFAQSDPAVTFSERLSAIEKKMDESQKREEQILANQEKILNEILISRKWAKRG